ncbi:Zinc/iron permease [Phycomyces nitens]|nr:Zinc/iron permease [Phycomyces nitens]
MACLSKPVYYLFSIAAMATLSYAQDGKTFDKCPPKEKSHLNRIPVDADTVADACDSGDPEDYNLPLRIGSIFIILGTSALGVFGPIALHRVSANGKNSPSDWILTIGKFFGTGVILATAFVHMLPDAFENFGSDCLSSGWLSYGAFAGIFCMIASFGLQLLELCAISHLNRINKRKALSAQEDAAAQIGDTSPKNLESDCSIISGTHGEQFQNGGHVHSAGFLEQDNSYGHIGTFILELGIVMHSVIIGITLATTSRDEFVTLLIALVFHQFFEGLALGTRINELRYKSLLKPIIMGCLYILMTPIGISIGVGIHASFNPNSYSSILAQAILDSLSAGILLYNAYVSLMSLEISHNTNFHEQSLTRKTVCFLSMYVGAGLMSLIGEWA